MTTKMARIEVPAELPAHARLSTSAQFDEAMEVIMQLDKYESWEEDDVKQLSDFIRDMLAGCFMTGWVDWATRAPTYERRT